VTGPPGDSIFANRTVFVLGGRRSGTTWLSQLLLSHPDLGGIEAFEHEGDAVPVEPLVFSALGDLWANAHRPDHDGLLTCLDRPAIAGALRAFCDRMFGAAVEHHAPGATWYVDKTPDNIDRLTIMAGVYPDAWFVNIVRDGRDVVRSLLAAPFSDITKVDDAAADWVRVVRDALGYSWRLERFREIRYEQLLLDPVGEASGILEWFGLPVTDEVRAELGERAGRPVARLGDKTPPGAGRWRELDPEDLAVIYDIAGDLLAELGYLDGGEDPPPA
jgi:hypothetical protein